ncbi:MAG: MaoC family dehydratase N-terminal domain-containing protein [Parasporobacterium sp.]|nr:MaoC family dehydratase N-terminal domain-containing protein [Parasporobacterium sp.]
MRDFNKDDFIIRYPGKYDEQEKPYVDAFFRELERINNRGPVDVQALISGTLPENTPGLGPVVPVTENMIRYNHQKYEQENPLFNDREYAKKAGYADIPAYFTFGAHDDSYTSPFPPAARDTLLVSQASHHVEHVNDVYAGDTLYMVIDKREMMDLTPEKGSIYRSCALYNEGTVYNQKGEIVNHVYFHYMESVKTYKPGRKPENFEAMGFAGFWEDPDWCSKEDHYYTDTDYEYMKSIWEKEEIRGSEPRYFEDVRVGDQPALTLEGPIIDCALPSAPYGQGIGGTRTMKKEILDSEIFRTMTQDSHGIYRLPNPEDYTPAIPDGVRTAFMVDDGRGEALDEKLDSEDAKETKETPDEDLDTADIHAAAGDERAAIINYVGRDLAIHHLNNWMGDAGRIESINWSIMPAGTHAVYGKPVPKSPYYHAFIQSAPAAEGMMISTHGLTRDIAEVHSQVVERYYKNGKAIARLIWWIQDINQRAWIEGSAEVSLPQKA